MVLVVNVRVALQPHATNSFRLSLSSFCMAVDHLHWVVMAAGRDCGQSRVIQVDLQAGYIVHRASDLLSSASVCPAVDSQKHRAHRFDYIMLRSSLKTDQRR